MSPLINHFRYRPEVDGLRAFAVLAVVLFHAGLGVPGGYLGVDVFFVISGYLITSLIFKDLQDSQFSLARFWERRARRILPAAIVMVLATMVAGWFLLLPSDYASFGWTAVWQALFAANFRFWLNTNYFAGPAGEQPLLHTWSLAVEEQFYLFFPLLLLGLFRFSPLASAPFVARSFRARGGGQLGSRRLCCAAHAGGRLLLAAHPRLGTALWCLGLAAAGSPLRRCRRAGSALLDSTPRDAGSVLPV